MMIFLILPIDACISMVTIIPINILINIDITTIRIIIIVIIALPVLHCTIHIIFRETDLFCFHLLIFSIQQEFIAIIPLLIDQIERPLRFLLLFNSLDHPSNLLRRVVLLSIRSRSYSIDYVHSSE